MKNVKELKKAIKEGRKLVWFDPQVIDGNNYLISYIETLQDDFDEDTPITIQYGEGSEAQVSFLEIEAVKTLNEYKELLGYNSLIDIVSIQENENVSDYPLEELVYVIEVINSSICFVDFEGIVRVCEL